MITLLKRSGDNLIFWCPACKYGHPFSLAPGRWVWNGKMDLPTFTPSLMLRGSASEILCHLFVTDGKIQFCADCPHSFRGKTVDMVPWETILGGEMEETKQSAPLQKDPTAAAAPLQPAPSADPAVTDQTIKVNYGAMPPNTNILDAGGEDPAVLELQKRREEAIAFVMSKPAIRVTTNPATPDVLYSREAAEEIVTRYGVTSILEDRDAEAEEKAAAPATTEELPDGHEHMRQCEVCNTWHTKGELACPQCGSIFPALRG